MENNYLEQQEFDNMYHNDLGMCGCGRPEDIKSFLYKLLQNHKKLKNEEITHEEAVKNRREIIASEDPDTIYEFVFNVLNEAGFLEHGGSVYGSWFTEKGEKFIDLLGQNLD